MGFAISCQVNYQRTVRNGGRKKKKRAKMPMELHIMLPQDQHPRLMQYLRQNAGDPDQMISMKNTVYVEEIGDTVGGRLLRLNNVECRCGESLRMQMISACMTLDSIVQYVSVGSKLNSENEGHIKDCHGQGNQERRDDHNFSEIQEDLTVGGDRSGDPYRPCQSASSAAYTQFPHPLPCDTHRP